MIIGAQFDDAYLVRRTRDGYVGAYEKLVLRHGPRIYPIAIGMLGDHFAAQHLAQEAFIAAWKSIEKSRAGVGLVSYPIWPFRVESSNHYQITMDVSCKRDQTDP